MGDAAAPRAQFGPPWTTIKLLNWTTHYFHTRGIPSPRLDAEWLLSHALGIERILLYAHFDRPLKPAEIDHYRAMVRRRAQREPLAYVLGTAPFWTIELASDKRALAPRADTEALIERALALLPESCGPALVVDVGTGSGALALAIATERPTARVAATDISADALALAGENAERLELTERVAFFEGDLLSALGGAWASEPLALIVSNPPYVAANEANEMDPEVTEFEPHQALFAGDDGLFVLRRLIPDAAHRLATGASLAVEIGHRQAEAVCALFEESGLAEISVAQDLGGRDRVVSGRRRGGA